MGTGEGISSTWCLFSPREMPGRWLHNSCCPFSLSRLLLGARLSSSFPSKVLGQAMCADDRVLLLQLFIMGAQEPGERFWVHRTFVSLLCLSAVMALLPSWQPVLFLGLSKVEAAPESRALWCQEQLWLWLLVLRHGMEKINTNCVVAKTLLLFICI